MLDTGLVQITALQHLSLILGALRHSVISTWSTLITTFGGTELQRSSGRALKDHDIANIGIALKGKEHDMIAIFWSHIFPFDIWGSWSL